MSRNRDNQLAPEAKSSLNRVIIASAKVDSTFDMADRQAALNLLAKVDRRMGESNPEQARALTERALLIQGRDGTRTRPVLWVAHNALTVQISQDLDLCDESEVEGDDGWIDRAERLIGKFGPVVDTEIRACLLDCLNGEELSPSQKRRLTALTVSQTPDTEPFAGVPEDELVDALIQMVFATMAHNRLVASVHN